jgi:histidinol-phosphate aminotransferase
VYLVDPNNPTGQPLPDGAAQTIAAAAPQALVLVDEAYADFSGRTLVGDIFRRHPNLVVGRTFAKGHGLAGLRIGALVGNPSTIAELARVVPPFNVNVAAVRALEAALEDHSYLRWYVEQAAESRRRIEAFCQRRGITYWPSVGNFMLVRLGPEAPNTASRLALRGIDVRDKSAAPGCAGCLRLTAGVVAHTEQLIIALEDILASRTNRSTNH